jgi:hypothetical protein
MKRGIQALLLALATGTGTGAAPSVARAAEPKLSIESVACPSAEAIRRALPPEALERELRLAVEASGTSSIRVTLSGAKVPLERTLAASDDCAVLAETVAHLVDAWLRELPWQGARPPPEEPPKPATAAPKAPTDLAESDEVAFEPEPLGWPLHAAVELLGGGNYASHIPAVWAGQLGLEIGVAPQVSVGVLGAVESAVGVASAPGSVRFQRTPFKLFGRWDLHDPSSLGVTLRGGPVLEWVAVEGLGFSLNRSRTVATPGVWAGVGLDWPILERLSLYVEASAELALIQDLLEVSKPTPVEVAKTPAISAGWTAGAALRFF